MKINAITNLENIFFGAKKIYHRRMPAAAENIAPPETDSNSNIPSYQQRYLRMLEGMQADGQEMADLCEQYARKYVIYKDENSKIAAITQEHCYLAFLDNILDYARKIESGKIEYSKEPIATAGYVADMTTQWVWSRENAQDNVKEIEEEYNKVVNALKEKSSEDAFVSGVMIDEDFMKSIEDFAAIVMAELGTYDIKNIGGSSALYISAMLLSKSTLGRNFAANIIEFFHKLSMVSTTDKIEENSAIMPYYQDIALHVIKNADKNYNMHITYSNNDESAPEYFVNSLVEQLNNIDDNEYKNLKNGKVKTIVFNMRSNFNVIADECNKCANDKDTQYFIIIKDVKNVFNSSLVQSDDGMPVISAQKIDDSLNNKAKNVHIILLSNQDDYYDLLNKQPVIEKRTRDYRNLQIPIMDENVLKEQVLSTKDYIASQIENTIEDDALVYIAGLPLNSKGSKYDNFIKFVKNLSFYYTDSEIITIDMVQSYWENMQKNDMAMEDSPYDIVFNTNKTLDSIKGTPMVKKQAQNVVYEMTNFPRTKGYVIYNNREGISGGRAAAYGESGNGKTAAYGNIS